MSQLPIESITMSLRMLKCLLPHNWIMREDYVNSVAMNLSDQEAEHLRTMPNSNQTHEKLAQIFSTRPDNYNEVENQIHILNNDDYFDVTDTSKSNQQSSLEQQSSQSNQQSSLEQQSSHSNQQSSPEQQSSQSDQQSPQESQTSTSDLQRPRQSNETKLAHAARQTLTHKYSTRAKAKNIAYHAFLSLNNFVHTYFKPSSPLSNNFRCPD